MVVNLCYARKAIAPETILRGHGPRTVATLQRESHKRAVDYSRGRLRNTRAFQERAIDDGGREICHYQPYTRYN